MVDDDRDLSERFRRLAGRERVDPAEIWQGVEGRLAGAHRARRRAELMEKVGPVAATIALVLVVTMGASIAFGGMRSPGHAGGLSERPTPATTSVAARAVPTPTPAGASVPATTSSAATCSPSPMPVPSSSRPIDLSTLGKLDGGTYQAMYRPEAGEYVLAIASQEASVGFPRYAPDTAADGDFVLKVDVRPVVVTGGPARAGLALQTQTQGTLIAGISSAGAATLFMVRPDNSWVILQPLAASCAVRTGPDARNHLEVTRHGDTITLAINGARVGTYDAALGPVVQMGLDVAALAGNSQVEGVFSGLQVTPSMP